MKSRNFYWLLTLSQNVPLQSRPWVPLRCKKSVRYWSSDAGVTRPHGSWAHRLWVVSWAWHRVILGNCRPSRSNAVARLADRVAFDADRCLPDLQLHASCLLRTHLAGHAEESMKAVLGSGTNPISLLILLLALCGWLGMISRFKERSKASSFQSKSGWNFAHCSSNKYASICGIGFLIWRHASPHAAAYAGCR